MGYMRLAIVMPTHENVPAFFAYDLALLVRDTSMAIEARVAAAKKAGEKFDAFFGIEILQGTYVHTARQELMQQMLNDDVTHVLWLDTDMRFPPDSLIRLLNHNLPMVGINYSKRRMPPEFVAIKKIGWNEGERSERLITDADAMGLEEVDAIGFGMVMMQVSALANMPDPKLEPWFWFKWMPEKQQQVGEDVHFCKLFKDSGQKIYVDHDLSKECGHLGQFDYRCHHVLPAMTEEVAA